MRPPAPTQRMNCFQEYPQRINRRVLTVSNARCLILFPSPSPILFCFESCLSYLLLTLLTPSLTVLFPPSSPSPTHHDQHVLKDPVHQWRGRGRYRAPRTCNRWRRNARTRSSQSRHWYLIPLPDFLGSEGGGGIKDGSSKQRWESAQEKWWVYKRAERREDE